VILNSLNNYDEDQTRAAANSHLKQWKNMLISMEIFFRIEDFTFYSFNISKWGGCMKNRIIKVRSLLLALAFYLGFFSSTNVIYAQTYKWLRVGDLQSPFSITGSEYEVEFSGFVGTNADFFAWQPQYGINQTVARAKGLFIGCENFYDPVTNTTYNPKVIGTGPKSAPGYDQFFCRSIKLIAKTAHPTVIVDDSSASDIAGYDVPDEIDPTLPCDRMIVVTFNTSLGISVTKKIMAFSQSNHDNYFIYDYVFKNTGIIDSAGTIRAQALDSVWFMWHYRSAFGGVSSLFGSTWGNYSSTWGISTLNHAFGENPTGSDYTNSSSLFYKLRGFYSYFSPTSSGNPQSTTYDEDWGCPNIGDKGELASAKYTGCVTLHADSSASDHADNPYQPKTTYYISPDIALFTSSNSSQYSQTNMSDRWTAMTEGHPAQQHDEIVGTTGTYAESWTSDARRNMGGGVAMDQGYGPYNIEVGDSVHIVFAEAASGIGWEKGCEVGANWLQWRTNGTGPTLTLPDGSTTSDYNAYKKAWIFSGKDSLLNTYQTALANYNSGYVYAQAPPAPDSFAVTSGGDRIQLQWSNNAASTSHFNGYVIYRSAGSINTYSTVYKKVFECNASNVVQQWYDTTAHADTNYYYYIQSKDDGTQISGKILYSSLFLTLTNSPARLNVSAANDYRSHQSGGWDDADTWERFDGSSWISPASSVPSSSSGLVTIRGNHILTVASSDTVTQLTLGKQATLVIQASGSLHFKDTHASSISGSLINNGSITQDNPASITFNGSSGYIHNTNGGSIPKATWASGSSCTITGITNSAPANTDQNFSIFTWNCPNQSIDMNLDQQGKSLGTLNILNTNRSSGATTHSLSLFNSNGSLSIDSLIVNGAGASLIVQNGNYSDTLSTGPVIISGGGLMLLSSNSDGSIVNYLTGSFTCPDSGSWGTETVNSHSTAIFNGPSNIFSVPSSSFTYIGGPHYRIAAGSISTLGTSIVSGTGSFTIDSGATISTAHPSGLNGNIQVAGTASFSTKSSYSFTGSASQITGSFLPDTIFGLTINNKNGVTASRNITVNGICEICRGKLYSGGNAVLYGTNGVLNYSGDSLQQTSDVEFPLLHGPNKLLINNSYGVILHSSRTLEDSVKIAGKLYLGTNSLATATATSADTNSYIVTDSTGSFILTSVTSSIKLCPIGIRSAYAPVWVANSGSKDTISVRAEYDSGLPVGGGHVKAKWDIAENTSGGGTYTIKLGWMQGLEDSAFTASTKASWMIFRLSDTTKIATTGYARTYSSSPHTLQHASITTLGTFTVGNFSSLTDVGDISSELPTEFSLQQNYPNPFNPSTTIKYQLPMTSAVTLKVYDLLGREVATLVNARQSAGQYSVQWNASKSSSGVYFYRLQAGSFVKTSKLILLK
jgi:hypothetical protein